MYTPTLGQGSVAFVGASGAGLGAGQARKAWPRAAGRGVGSGWEQGGPGRAGGKGNGGAKRAERSGSGGWVVAVACGVRVASAGVVAAANNRYRHFRARGIPMLMCSSKPVK